MRRPIFRMNREDAKSLLGRAPYLHIATTSDTGAPIFRTLHGVLHDDALIFHGGPKGEKTLAMGREAVVSAVEMVAEIPSWFTDPVRACPATTYYESVQVHGTLSLVEAMTDKAIYMQALMERFQPSGRYQSLSDPANEKLYQASLKGLHVFRIGLEGLVGKSKLGQHLRPDKRSALLEKLWERGEGNDHKAIQRILRANPGTPLPSFLRAPEGIELLCDVTETRDIVSAVAMLEDAYWNADVTAADITSALRHSPAVVGARERESGQLIGVMRGVSDQGKHAWVYDVMVAPQWRQSGIGTSLMQLLLAHPKMRGARKYHLQTKDAQAWYTRFGFCDIDALPPRPFATSRMYKERREVA